MKLHLSYSLILPLLAVAVLAALAVMAAPATAAYATPGIPGDANHDNVLTNGELSSQVLSYLAGSASLNDTSDAAYVYAYWDGQPKSIVDTNGKTSTFYRPIRTIVALSTAGMEVIRGIHAESSVVGVSTYIIPALANYYPEMTSMPTVGTGSAPNYESIIALNPDLIVQTPSWSTDAETKLAGTGIQVVRLGFTINNFTKEVTELGDLLGHQADARKLTDFYQGYLDEVASNVSQVPDSQKPRVFMEYDPVYESDTRGSLAQLCTAAGGVNLVSGLSAQYPIVDPEWLIAQNPDAIIKFPYSQNALDGYLAVNNTTSMKNIANAVMARAGLDQTNAVKNKDVFIVGQTIASGPRSLIALLYMAKWLYPQKFAGLDPQAVHQEYITEFQGLSYNLSQQGAFVYAANGA